LPNTRRAPENQPKFSSFFKKIVVEIDRDNQLYPGNLIEVSGNILIIFAGYMDRLRKASLTRLFSGTSQPLVITMLTDLKSKDKEMLK
jgi:hypothetical protein